MKFLIASALLSCMTVSITIIACDVHAPCHTRSRSLDGIARQLRHNRLPKSTSLQVLNARFKQTPIVRPPITELLSELFARQSQRLMALEKSGNDASTEAQKLRLHIELILQRWTPRSPLSDSGVSSPNDVE